MPPEWRIEPHDVSVTVGKTAVIDCQADAFPAARIEWRLSQGKFTLVESTSSLAGWLLYWIMQFCVGREDSTNGLEKESSERVER